MHSMDVHAPIALPGLDVAAFPDRVVTSSAMRNDPMLAEADALQALGGGEISLREESPSGLNIRGGASDQTTTRVGSPPVWESMTRSVRMDGTGDDGMDGVPRRSRWIVGRT